MIFILSVCIKWSSDHDNMELFQDTFIIGVIRLITTNYINAIMAKGHGGLYTILNDCWDTFERMLY